MKFIHNLKGEKMDLFKLREKLPEVDQIQEEVNTQEKVNKEHRTDTIYLYFKNIEANGTSILSREEEYQLAKKIETAYREIAEILFSNKFCLNEFKKLFKKLETVRIKKFIRIGVPMTHEFLNQRKNDLLEIVTRINDSKGKDLNSQEKEILVQKIVKFDLQYRYLDIIEEKFKKLAKIKKDENLEKTAGLSREILVEDLGKIDYFKIIIKETINIMWEKNLKLPVLMAKNFEGRGIEFSDLISAGNNGLRGAIKIFDYRRQNRLITIAVWWIGHEMLKLIAKQGTSIRLSSNLQISLKNLNYVVKKMKQEFKREIDLTGRDFEEILKRTGLSPQKAKFLISRQKNMIVDLDNPISDENDGTMNDLVLQDSKETEMAHFHSGWAVQKVMEMLEKWKEEGKIKNNEYTTFVLRYPLGDKEPMTLEEIGTILNLTRERVRQMEEKVKKKFSYYRDEIAAAAYYK